MSHRAAQCARPRTRRHHRFSRLAALRGAAVTSVVAATLLGAPAAASAYGPIGSAFGSAGSGAGQFASPQLVEVDTGAAGGAKVLVLDVTQKPDDSWEAHIERFELNGTFVDSTLVASEPQTFTRSIGGMAVDPTARRLYLTRPCVKGNATCSGGGGANESRIEVFDLDSLGTAPTTFADGLIGESGAQLPRPRAIAVSPVDGKVFVAGTQAHPDNPDTHQDTVRRFTSAGAADNTFTGPTEKFGPIGDTDFPGDDTALDSIAAGGMTVDSAGKLVVADAVYDPIEEFIPRVQRLPLNGGNTPELRKRNSSVLPFEFVRDIAVGSGGDISVGYQAAGYGGITQMTSTGSKVRVIGDATAGGGNTCFLGSGSPVGIAADAGAQDLIVLEALPLRVQRLGASGTGCADTGPTPADPVGNPIVDNPAPPAPIFRGQVVTLSGTIPYSDPDGGPLQKIEIDYENDGVVDDTYGPADILLDYDVGPYTTVGPKTVRIKVTDEEGASSEFFVNLTIENRKPTASFTATPSTVNVGQVVALDGSASADASEEASAITEYRWDFDGDGTTDSTTAVATTTWTPTTAGDQNVALRVVDADGGVSSPVFRSVTVNNPGGGGGGGGGGGSTGGGSTGGGSTGGGSTGGGSTGGGSTGGGSTPLGGTGPIALPDTTKPVVKIGGGSSLTADKKNKVAFTIGCPAGETRCTGTVALETATAVAAAKKKKKKRKLSLGKASFTAGGGASTKVTVTLSSAARKYLRKSRKVKARVTVTAKDAAGNSGTTSRTVTIKAAKRR